MHIISMMLFTEVMSEIHSTILSFYKVDAGQQGILTYPKA